MIYWHHFTNQVLKFYETEVVRIEFCKIKYVDYFSYAYSIYNIFKTTKTITTFEFVSKKEAIKKFIELVQNYIFELGNEEFKKLLKEEIY